MMKKVIIQLLMAICVIFIINCGSVHASSVDIKRSTEKWFFPAKGEISDIFDSRGGEHKGIDIAGKYMSPIYANKGWSGCKIVFILFIWKCSVYSA